MIIYFFMKFMAEGLMILKRGEEEAFFSLDQPRLFRCSTECSTVKLFGQGLSGTLSSASQVKLTSHMTCSVSYKTGNDLHYLESCN